MIYFIYLLYSIALVYAASYLFGQRKKEVFFIASGVLLTLFLGYRDIYSGGIDLLRYDATYDMLFHAKSMNKVSEIRGGENVLFFLCMFLSAKLGWSFNFFLLLLAAFSVSACMMLYYRYSKYPLLCVCMFLPTCYIHLFSQLKQTLAVSIVIFAYIFFRQNRRYVAYTILGIAILFHPTALVMVPFFILSRYRANTVLLVALFTVSLLVFILRMEIGQFLTMVFYDQYLNKWESRESVTGMALLFIMMTFFYIRMMSKPWEVSKEKFLIVSSYLYALIIAMSFFFCASYSYAFTRLNNYFMIFLPLILSEMTEFKSWKNYFHSKFSVKVIFGVIMLIMINWFLSMVVSLRLDLYKFYWME